MRLLEFQFYLFMAQNYCIIKIFLNLILHLFWKNNVRIMYIKIKLLQNMK